jgi:hypothetical protein
LHAMPRSTPLRCDEGRVRSECQWKVMKPLPSRSFPLLVQEWTSAWLPEASGGRSCHGRCSR